MNATSSWMDPWTVAEPSWTLALGIAGLLLAAILVTFELRRGRLHTPRRRLLRLAATVGCVLAVFLLALRPARWRSIDPRAGVLYTAGATSQPLATEDESRPARQFSLAEIPRLTEPGPSDAQPIPDTAYLARQYPQLRRLRVLGHGLDPWQLSAIATPIDRAEAPPPSPGLERISWSRSLTLGEILPVQGRWAVGEETGFLELVGPGGVVASREIPPAPEEDSATAARLLSFAFTTRPRATGRFLYRLRFRPAKDPSLGNPAAHEVPLDVTVIEPQPVRILWLESAPRFETRHFKNWLAETEGHLALRTAISRDRYRRERQGDGPQAPARLTTERLRDFDLVVADRSSLAQLGRGEVELLRREISDRGLGLLLLPYGERQPSAARLRQLSLDIKTLPVDDLEELAIRLAWAGTDPTQPTAPADTQNPIPTLRIQAREIALEGTVEPLAFDTAGRALVARKPLGLGYSGVTLLSDTFRWILEGAAPIHHRYWSLLLGSLARPTSGERWQLPTQPALLDRPLEVVLWSTAEKPTAEVLTPDDERLSLALALDEPWDGRQPQPWRGRLWPRQEGWYGLATTPTGPVAAFYGHPSEPRSSWSSWIEAQRRQATSRRVRQDSSLSTPIAKALQRSQRHSLPRWPAYLLLVASLSTLWIDERLTL